MSMSQPDMKIEAAGTFTPAPEGDEMAPVPCGKRTDIDHNGEHVVIFCIQDKGHPGPHRAEVAWNEEPEQG
jgi:hypothetical protein